MQPLEHTHRSASYFTRCTSCQMFLALSFPGTCGDCTSQTLCGWVAGRHRVTGPRPSDVSGPVTHLKC